MKEDLKEIFKNVNDWLKYAEAKNAMLLGFNGVLLFGAFKVFHNNPDLQNSLGFIGSYYHYVMPIIVGVSTVITLISFIPKTKMIKLGDNSKPKQVNVLFYSHLKTLSSEDLLEELKVTEPSVIEKSYAQQIVINSSIAAAKFDSFKVAGWITISGLILIFPVVFLLSNFYKRRFGKKEIS
jgi:hypothetical protein